jgi:hypothetical protein
VLNPLVHDHLNYCPNNHHPRTGEIRHTFSFLVDNLPSNFICHSNSPDRTLETFRELLRNKRKKKEKKRTTKIIRKNNELPIFNFSSFFCSP